MSHHSDSMRASTSIFEMGAVTPMTFLRGIRIVLTATIAALAVLLTIAVPAGAAPGLGVEITRDEDVLPVVHRSDLRVDFDIKVTNVAGTLAGVGDVIPCTQASAGGVSPIYTYAWRRNGQLIAGQTASSYTVVPADVGAVLQCQVRAVNSSGTGPGGMVAASQAGVTVAPAPAIESPVAPTGATGVPLPTPANPIAGTVLACATGTWTGVTQPFEYEWYGNGSRIAGATDSTYTVQAADVPSAIQCAVTGSNGETAVTKFSGRRRTGPAPAPAEPNLTAVDMGGGNQTTGTVTADIELPPGADVERFYVPHAVYTQDSQTPTLTPAGWTCTAVPASDSQNARATCTRADTLPPGQSYPIFSVAVALGAAVPDTAVTAATVSGGGAPASASAASVFSFAPALTFGIESFETYVRDGAGAPFSEAGAHPHRAGAEFSFPSYRELKPALSTAARFRLLGRAKTIRTETPRGFVGNTLAIEDLCPTLQHVVTYRCPAGSAVGAVTLDMQQAGIFGDLGPLVVYAVEPEKGRPAQFAFTDPVVEGVYAFHPRLRPEDGYGITLEAAPLPAVFPSIRGIRAEICGFGAKTKPNPTNASQVLFDSCLEKSDPLANDVPLLSLPPRCGETPPSTVLRADSWESPGVFESAAFTDPAQTDCGRVRFDPLISLEPTSTAADAASGLDVELSMPSGGLEDRNGVAEAHLKKTVVELPEGVSVNPSAATGLEGCSDAQLGLGTDSEPGCPDGSKIASVEASTPVLEESLSGVMVLRTPESTDPQSGDMLRMALIVRNDERGLLVKLPGSATADLETGRLIATFDENPELPIGKVKVRLKGGPRGALAMPQDCGERSVDSVLSPWKGAANTNANARESSDPFTVGGDCSNGFSPAVEAGMDRQAARATASFSFKFWRKDGEQWLRGLTAKLPQGLLASVRDVPLCSNSQADVGDCPASSKIGVVDAKAGSGDPFVLEEKGEVFLTEGYKGGQYGLAVKVRPVAGPFRGEHELSPIIVRQAIHVDRRTAQVTAISDPFPLIHHGIPLRVREVLVKVDRPGFMLNPSDCDAKQVGADLLSADGVTAGLGEHFQAVNCSNLAFRPELALSLTGRRQITTGKHPGIRAVVTQIGTSEAGIEQAVVRLPKSLALDPNNAQALCEFADGTKPDLENRCPAGSIVGRARAKTPLLKDDLVGNVYFVKNVRRDPVTGNEIRTLPMIIVALRGEIAVNLRGESSTTKAGKLVNTFGNVPDAPISQFNLNIRGGQSGIIAVTRTRRAKINLCAGRHVAEADLDGHNGRRHDTDVAMSTPCTRKQTRAAKRKALRAAARAGRS